LANFQRVEQLLFLCLKFFLQYQALREHDAMTLMVEIDHL